MNDLGKWAWLIGLALLVLMGALSGFVSMDLAIVSDIAVALAFIGGIMHLAKGDRTAFFIAALALGAFYSSAGTLFVDILGNLVAGILGGAATAAAAGAAGALVMTVYEWVMP